MSKLKMRVPKTETTLSEITPEQVEKFAKGADSFDQPVKNSPDPNSKEKFKSITVPFNEFEYLQLERLAQKMKRSKLSLIRFAISELDNE
jgi:hypothetical protein